MSVNRYVTHLLVLPEDDANRQIANGFELEMEMRRRSFQVLPAVGGWSATLEAFRLNHARSMSEIPKRHLVLLIDFDRDPQRLARAKEAIPDGLMDRVFIIGSWSEPEELRANPGSYESIGRNLAVACRDGDLQVWRHPLLNHNEGEVERLRTPFSAALFRGRSGA